MAEGGDNTAPCDLCDGQNEINRKCLTCDEFMCESCSRIHSKSRQSRDHDIITIADSEKLTALVPYQPREDDDQADDIDDIDDFCEEHEGERCILFCVTRGCNCLVCRVCILDYHQGHRFVEIDDVLTSFKRHEADRSREEIENCILPYLTEKKMRLTAARESVLNDIQSKKETVKHRYEELRKELDKHYQTTLSGLANAGKANIEIIDTLGKSIDFHISRLRSNLTTGEKRSENRNDIGYIKYARMLETDIESTPEVLIPSFNRLMLNTHGNCTISDIFGDLEEVVECEPEVISRSSTGFPEVSSICPVSPFAAWHGHYKHRGIQLLEVDECDHLLPGGGFGKSGVLNMAATPEGDMYMVIYGSNDVIMLKTDGSVEKIYDTRPYVALGIAVTKNRDILLCLAESYPNEMNPNGKRRVARITNFGITRDIIEKGTEGQDIFVYPFRVGENINGDIGVIDHVGDAEGLLVLLNSEGTTRFTYNGREQLEGQVCNLTDITFDGEGCILMSDVTNQCIHMLSKDGKFLRFVDVYIYYNAKLSPTTLAVDSSECLWVGGVSKHRYFNRTDAHVVRVKYKM